MYPFLPRDKYAAILKEACSQQYLIVNNQKQNRVGHVN